MALRVNISGDGIVSLGLLLERFGDNISDLRDAFDDMADVFVNAQRANFGSGGGHYGYWQPLSPDYAARKAVTHPGAPILTRSGLLRASLTERPLGVEHIDAQRMVLGTQVDYAAYHQNGAGFLPQRKIIDQPTPSETRQYGSILHRHAFEGVAP